MIKISSRVRFLVKNKKSIKKPPPTKVEGFQMFLYDPSQTRQIAFTEKTVKFGTFQELDWFIFVLNNISREVQKL